MYFTVPNCPLSFDPFTVSSTISPAAMDFPIPSCTKQIHDVNYMPTCYVKRSKPRQVLAEVSM